MRITIASLNNDDLPTHYRFETKEKLYQLLECFQFPQKMRSQHGHTFTGEEVLLVGLHHLCYPGRLNDSYRQTVFGMDYQTVSKAFHLL